MYYAGCKLEEDENTLFQILELKEYNDDFKQTMEKLFGKGNVLFVWKESLLFEKESLIGKKTKKVDKDSFISFLKENEKEIKKEQKITNEELNYFIANLQ